MPFHFHLHLQNSGIRSMHQSTNTEVTNYRIRLRTPDNEGANDLLSTPPIDTSVDQLSTPPIENPIENPIGLEPQYQGYRDYVTNHLRLPMPNERIQGGDDALVEHLNENIVNAAQEERLIDVYHNNTPLNIITGDPLEIASNPNPILVNLLLPATGQDFRLVLETVNQYLLTGEYAGVRSLFLSFLTSGPNPVNFTVGNELHFQFDLRTVLFFIQPITGIGPLPLLAEIPLVESTHSIVQTMVNDTNTAVLRNQDENERLFLQYSPPPSRLRGLLALSMAFYFGTPLFFQGAQLFYPQISMFFSSAFSRVLTGGTPFLNNGDDSNVSRYKQFLLDALQKYIDWLKEENE